MEWLSGCYLEQSERFFANFDLYLVWDSSPKGSEWLFGFARDSSASRAEGENRKFIIGKSIFSIWIWVYPFSARRSSRLWMTIWCSGLLCYCLWWRGEGCIKYFRFNCDCLIYNQQNIKNTFFEEVVVEYKTQFTV